MKRTLLLLTLGAVLACPASFAQAESPTNAPSQTPPPGGPPHDGRGGLTEEEKQELHAAHDAAIKADPSLDTEGKALKEQMEAYNKKLHAAMVKADPKVEPILAKLDASRGHHGGPDGPPPAK